MPAPPMSLQGARDALRWPTGQDLLFSVKAVLAVTLALLVGFSQNLENPYWSALTVYVLVSQPQTGAIRSKGLYRFAGTLVGGWASIGLTALFGSNVGVLLGAHAVFITLALYAKLLERTPANYFWFATSLTAAVVGLTHVQTPEAVFAFGIARMTEIGLGVLAITLVDSILAPRPQTHVFLDILRAWRDASADWIANALSPEASDEPQARLARRKALRAIAAKSAVHDAQGVQLPFDVIETPLDAHALRFLRLTTAKLVAQLTSANVWAEAVRGLAPDGGDSRRLAAEARAWLAAKPPLDGRDIARHVSDGRALAVALGEAAEGLIDAGDRDAVMRGSALLRLQELVETWIVHDQVISAMAAGRPLAAPLRRAAHRARPIRSLDYVATALDVAPLALAFAGCTLVWYMTAWSAGLNPMLFAYVICGFILGTPGAVKSAIGALVWVSCAFALTFLYQFAILPQVTAFPTLIAVLAVALIPFGVFMAMSAAGLLILANAFSFLGLQSAYAGDFQTSLESLTGSIAGCFIAIAAIYLCGYDEPGFRARRLARALARDVADTAGARRVADRDRYVSLTIDRLSLFYGAVAEIPADDPIHGHNMISRFRVGAAVLALRHAEAGLPAEALAAARRLRHGIAAAYRRGTPPSRAPLLAEVETAYDEAAAAPSSPARREALAALAGLRIAFRPDEAFEALLRTPAR